MIQFGLIILGIILLLVGLFCFFLAVMALFFQGGGSVYFPSVSKGEKWVWSVLSLSLLFGSFFSFHKSITYEYGLRDLIKPCLEQGYTKKHCKSKL